MYDAPINDDERTLVEKVEKLQAGYIGIATQGGGSLDAMTFARLRQEITADPKVSARVPDIVRKYRDAGQFWQFIKHQFPTYRERRDWIRAQFRPLLDCLEFQERTPCIPAITARLESFDSREVLAAWEKALNRCMGDPEGAITAARMLLETVCKHI